MNTVLSMLYSIILMKNLSKTSIKTSLCSVPVEGTNDFRTRKNRNEGEMPILPKVAIISLIEAMKKADFSESTFDFFDIDMLHPVTADEDIQNYFLDRKPHVVGLSAVVSTSYQQIKRISSIIRKNLPETWIVMGGNLAASSEAVLKSTEVDLTVVGDGEIAWVKILEHIIKYPDRKNQDTKKYLWDVKGVAFLDEANDINLNGFGTPVPQTEMPVPDYDLLKKGLNGRDEMLQNYLRKATDIGWFDFDERSRDPKRGKWMASIYTSKGCVAKCTFCQRSTKGYKVQPMEHLDNHLQYLKKHMDVGHILISDENFGSDKKQAYQVADIMKKNDMLWMACGVRCTSTLDEDVKYYRERGCCTLKYGIETGSQTILDLMEKVFTVGDSMKAIEACSKYGVHSPIHMLIGMPGETEKTIIESGIFLGKIAANMKVHPRLLQTETCYALPLPGTPLWEYGEQVGVIGKDVESQIDYLSKVADVGTYKRYYINLNGAPIGEVLFWETLLKLEASRVFHQNIKKSKVKISKISEIYKEQERKRFEKNPNQSLKYTALEFTFISYFIDHYIIANKYFDMIPRIIAYPFIKGLLYFEFMIQKRFASNRKNNLFMNKHKIKRLDFDRVKDEKSLKKKSLRGFVVEKRPHVPSLSNVEKVRHALRVGL